jgi:phage gp36-like protein
MSYASLTDLQERLGGAVYVQLTDDVGTGVPDEDVAGEALGGAEGEANSFLARRYAVPVETAEEPEVAALLKSITLDLAEYRLHSRRSSVPQDVRLKREAAVRWLQLVAAGQAVLPTRREQAGNPALAFAGEMVGSPRVLTRKELDKL